MFKLLAATAIGAAIAAVGSSPLRAGAAPGPAAPATPQPSAAPSAAPALPYVRLLATDLIVASRTNDAFAPHASGSVTQDLRAAVEYRFLGRNFGEFEYRRFRYGHPANDATIPSGAPCPAIANDPGCVTQIGGTTSAYVPAARQTEQQFELHTSLVGIGHAYLATSTFGRVASYGYPRLRSDIGFGAELLPALERPFSLSAAFYYYPEVRGTTTRSGSPVRLRYKLETFDLRAQASLPRSPFFLEIGVYGDRYLRKENAPSDASHRAFELGVGVHA